MLHALLLLQLPQRALHRAPLLRVVLAAPLLASLPTDAGKAAASGCTGYAVVVVRQHTGRLVSAGYLPAFHQHQKTHQRSTLISESTLLLCTLPRPSYQLGNSLLVCSSSLSIRLRPGAPSPAQPSERDLAVAAFRSTYDAQLGRGPQARPAIQRTAQQQPGAQHCCVAMLLGCKAPVWRLKACMRPANVGI